MRWGNDRDHDLLLVINTKLDGLAAAQATLAKQTATDTQRLEARITLLERGADRQAGMLQGGKLVWAILGALPPSVVVVLLGLGR